MTSPRFLNPETIAKPFGYTHVIETGPGTVIYISGQLGLDLNGKLVGGPGDFKAQATQTFVNMKAALAAVGADFQHIVKLNNYLTSMEYLPIFRDVRDSFVNVAAPPASTTVAISQLAIKEALFEMEAIAVLPPR
ncbi:MAG: RidA family protein [Bradyrhizobiaceae bacterium]|nr:RidA family protein [Bradyrhizobiaceae bacterium]